jgi:hypothetical protein
MISSPPQFNYKSRYNVDRIITKINDDTFSIEGESLYARLSYFPEEFIREDTSLADKIYMFDFEGGPALFVGGYFSLPDHLWSDRVRLPVVTEIKVETFEKDKYKVIFKVLSDHEYTRTNSKTTT